MLATMESNGKKRPNAALINREWYDSAREILSMEELGSAVLNAIAYVLYGDELPPITSKVGIVCRMIKPALDSDLEKYAERCERNAANARAKRVAASGSESQRVEATTTTTTTTTPNSTSTSISISEEDKEKERRKEIWLIYGYFWSIGSNAVREETRAFWSYYESLGWKNNKGAAIVSKLAAARMWRRQFETKEPKSGAAAWFNACKGCDLPDYSVWDGFAGAEKQGDDAIIRVRFRHSFYEDLVNHVPTLERDLMKAWSVKGLRIETAVN